MNEGESLAIDHLALSQDGTNVLTRTSPTNGTVGRSPSKSSSSNQNTSSNPPFPPPKTDKPRPHVCTTCERSFARLEHLKRHERSHTKEKPFECPECARCFARRDLLLRHQQKLHSTSTPSSRPRTGRRESAVGVSTGRVRKNSVANSSTFNNRPRANTLSHVDTATIGMLANTNPGFAASFQNGHSHHNSFGGLSSLAGFEARGVLGGNNMGVHGLPRLETSGFSADLSGGLRTAPPYGGFGAELGFHAFAYGSDNANTINPHALHMSDMHSLGMDAPTSPFHQMFSTMPTSQAMLEEDTHFNWIAQGFENQMTFAQAHESAIETSSPSAMSTSSPGAVSDAVLDGNRMVPPTLPVTTTPMWPNAFISPPQMTDSPSAFEFPSSSFNEMMPAPLETVSPKSLLAQSNRGGEINFSTPPSLSSIDSSVVVPACTAQPFSLPFGRNGGTSTTSTSSMDSSLRQSSITTTSGELVSEHIRNNLIAFLSQNAGFGQHKYSQPSISSPLSPRFGTRTKSFNANNFPNTQDLQRYISAYIQFFHPHLPFLHIPSLSFESPEYITSLPSVSVNSPFGHSSIASGGGCLILSLAAIGALYEQETSHSRDLFECAKKLISSYLEERRKSNMSKTQFGTANLPETEDTPLWLVQAMLLNVIYGFNCGDKTAAEIASRHCAALVGLARGAELARPYPVYTSNHVSVNGILQQDMAMGDLNNDGWNSIVTEPDDSDWRGWKVMEERKRTLYAVFILSSLLVSAYNHPPALTNSEIRLDLPCEEELWFAENAQTWRSMGGATAAESKAVPFGAALAHLLTAASRLQHQSPTTSATGAKDEELVESELKPSSFGCLILVNALHNYIWETRQRHLGRQWTTQETEQMHAHIEPALRAWQAAWASNPSHSLERPNPFGAGPLSADSIPLLDLAYVRLFVNFGRSKEAFWQRDYDAMAEELAHGSDVVQQAGSIPSPGSERNDSPDQSTRSTSPHGSATDVSSPVAQSHQALGQDDAVTSLPTNSLPSSGEFSRRERYLRKAAFYAADSLSMSDKLGLSFAEHTSRELPLQSAMCAFDCAQVLAEWVTTVQERVGRYLGVLGRDEMDLLQVPGIILLEDEDRSLLVKIDKVLRSAEAKMHGGSASLPTNESGYGSNILCLTAQMLERAAVWPVTKLMAKSLVTQAAHMTNRARTSAANQA